MSQTKRRNTVEARLRHQLQTKTDELAGKDQQITALDSRLSAATTLWNTTRTELRQLRDKHSSIERIRPLGRGRSTALFCRKCATELYPCETVRNIDRLIIRLQTK